MRGINVLLTLKDRFTAPLRRTVDMTQQMQRQVKKANLEINHFGLGLKNKVSNIVSSIGTIGGALGAVSAGAFIADGLQTYKDFDQAMHDVAGTLGLSAEQANRNNADFALLEATARKMGATTAFSAKEAADGLKYMVLAGMDAKTSCQALPMVLNLATASGMELGRASDLATDSLAALGLGVNDLEKYLNVATQAQSKSNQSTQDMMEAFIGAGSSLSNMGDSIENYSSILGLLANRGTKGAEAGTAMKALNANLKSNAEFLQENGIASYDAEGKYRGFSTIVQDLNEKTKDMTQAQRDALFMSIAGKDHLGSFNKIMEGLNATTTDGRNEFEALRESLMHASDGEGALKRTADTMADTLPNAIKGVESAINEAQIVLFDTFGDDLKNNLQYIAGTVIPALTNELAYFGQTIVPAIKNELQYCYNVLGGFKGIAPILAGLGAAFAVSEIINKVKSIAASLKTIQAGAKAAGGALRFLATINPFGTWGLAIGLAVMALVALYNHCEGFRNGVIEIFNGLMMFLKGVFVGDWAAVWEGVKVITEGVINALSSLLDSFCSSVRSAINSITGNNDETVEIEAGNAKPHATGTSYFSGGKAEVGEHGGEIINLPTGTQIIPHDESIKQVAAQSYLDGQKATPMLMASQTSVPNINININVQGNIIGNDDYANHLGEIITQKIRLAIKNI